MNTRRLLHLYSTINLLFGVLLIVISAAELSTHFRQNEAESDG